MNRVHVFVRCYVDRQLAPAPGRTRTSFTAPRSFPLRGSPYHFAHNVNDLQPGDYPVDAAVAVPGNR